MLISPALQRWENSPVKASPGGTTLSKHLLRIVFHAGVL